MFAFREPPVLEMEVVPEKIEELMTRALTAPGVVPKFVITPMAFVPSVIWSNRVFVALIVAPFTCVMFDAIVPLTTTVDVPTSVTFWLWVADDDVAPPLAKIKSISNVKLEAGRAEVNVIVMLPFASTVALVTGTGGLVAAMLVGTTVKPPPAETEPPKPA